MPLQIHATTIFTLQFACSAVFHTWSGGRHTLVQQPCQIVGLCTLLTCFACCAVSYIHCTHTNCFTSPAFCEEITWMGWLIIIIIMGWLMRALVNDNL
jgi:hypothetical protein